MSPRSPFAADVAPVALVVGADVWILVCGEETGAKGRRSVLGAARGVVSALPGDDYGEDPERYTVRVTVADGPGQALIGTDLLVRRCDLFARADKGEHAAFGDHVRKLMSRD